jgi:hypothetical protein
MAGSCIVFVNEKKNLPSLTWWWQGVKLVGYDQFGKKYVGSLTDQTNYISH